LPLVMSQPGMTNWLLAMLGQYDVNEIDLECRLFVNNFTPSLAMVKDDFVEASFTGYAPVALPWADWQAPTLADDRMVSVFDTSPIEWLNSGSAQTVYGYFFLEPVEEVVWLAEEFATPRLLGTSATLQVDLKLYLRNDPLPPE
jgi:hypothetical protein